MPPWLKNKKQKAMCPCVQDSLVHVCKSTWPKALSPAGPSQRQNQRWPVRMVEVRVNRCRPPTQHQFIGLIHLVAILALNTSRAMELNVEFPARVSNQYRHQDGRYVNNAHYRRNCKHTHRIDPRKKFVAQNGTISMAVLPTATSNGPL